MQDGPTTPATAVPELARRQLLPCARDLSSRAFATSPRAGEKATPPRQVQSPSLRVAAIAPVLPAIHGPPTQRHPPRARIDGLMARCASTPRGSTTYSLLSGATDGPASRSPTSPPPACLRPSPTFTHVAPINRLLPSPAFAHPPTLHSRPACQASWTASLSAPAIHSALLSSTYPSMP
ncbi:hypothetical protein C2845_PM03G29510 [Panicum miliaceum]|uniref:Uncharacterized protein n=1 Tax=Panicum miliaceum TaxID=4540 RepID=A0A3L6TG70_PANMI|nr:hypothetical protein C2845_PM03G29510 [Panicum miliaceum]